MADTPTVDSLPDPWPYTVHTPAQSGSLADPSNGDTFGIDLFFNGNLQLTPKNDYQLVSGEENLRRAIIRMLVINPGDYKYRPEFGVGILRYVKKPLNQSNLRAIEHRIRDQISRDRRIDKILTLTVEAVVFGTDSPGISIRLVIQAKGRKVQFQPFNFARTS